MYALSWGRVFYGVRFMSVSPPNANHMMRSQKNSGSAESGFGVVVSGFYSQNSDVMENLAKLDVDQGPFSEIALCENDGWTLFLGVSEEPQLNLSKQKVAFYRRECHRFFEDLPSWLYRTKAVHIHRMALSQSSGYLSLTMLYSENGSGV